MGARFVGYEGVGVSRPQEAQEGEGILSRVETGDSGRCVACHRVEEERVQVWECGGTVEEEV